MDNEKLVELITAEVLRRLGRETSRIPAKPAEPAYKALAIFTGGTIGLEVSLEELKKLQARGIEITVVLSQAAETIIGENWIKEKLGSRIQLVTTQSPYPGKHLRAADVVLVPVLTQNTAARLAHTLSDTMVCTVLLQALMLGKPVIAASNAADPADNWRMQKNMANAAPALREALAANLKKIETFGIRLIPVERLAAAAKEVLNREALPVLPGIAVKPAKKQILDAEAVNRAVRSGHKTITVVQGTIITPLACDIARESGLHIVYT
ncbi:MULTISPECIES: flavoprotein [Sporomusa]|uniref:flavoprotein n=1 Tax=Sporomusa TaxID=2375 RepID=UPI002CDFDD2D|nr:flavoprotein [Sporomusa sphaeroides]HML34530.1 flavoprotein [Sporomusa sphaeroides]